MGVARTELLRAARLSRLRFSEAELERLSRELDGILLHVEQLLGIEVDVAAAAPLSPPAAPADRPDVPAPDPLRQPVVERAPESRGGFFTVPRVLPP